VFRFAGFELDPRRAELRRADGAIVRLRPKSFELLSLFAANAGRMIGKQELVEAVWPNVHVGDDSLFQCIREIRVALGDNQRQMVRLVTGRGYIFDVAVSVEPDGQRTGDAPPEGAGAALAAETRPALFGRRRQALAAAMVALCTVVGLAVAAPALRPDLIFKRQPPAIAVMPIVDASGDPAGTAMAAGITGRLLDGLASIENVRVVTPRPANGTAAPAQASALSAPADFVLWGELQRDRQSWTLQARMIRANTGEVHALATASVDAAGTDSQLLQSRLAAGTGHPLALQLNGYIEADESAVTRNGSPAGPAGVVIEQAAASINQTTRERFGVARTLLREALAREPENVDLAVALAALQLRGIQMSWYDPDEAVAAEAEARTTLERALQAKPNYIPVLETYCRFLSATNRFAESLVACARTLRFDPWNGQALYLVGLGQLHLGRFDDALATFRQADQFDTPQVSRWTWLLGAGWANVIMGRGEDALPWLERSIAITPASGRSHMLLAAAYQQIGRVDDARTAMQAGLTLRPGSTALNVAPPAENTSPVYVEASRRIIGAMIEAGLPER
jgi:DNA-binding winged helix-turn-helix (wHTH) protein/Flp pilus assembly protein TadD